jgi:hypothetical protein
MFFDWPIIMIRPGGLRFSSSHLIAVPFSVLWVGLQAWVPFNGLLFSFKSEFFTLRKQRKLEFLNLKSVFFIF